MAHSLPDAPLSRSGSPRFFTSDRVRIGDKIQFCTDFVGATGFILCRKYLARTKCWYYDIQLDDVVLTRFGSSHRRIDNVEEKDLDLLLHSNREHRIADYEKQSAIRKAKK